MRSISSKRYRARAHHSFVILFPFSCFIDFHISKKRRTTMASFLSLSPPFYFFLLLAVRHFSYFWNWPTISLSFYILYSHFASTSSKATTIYIYIIIIIIHHSPYSRASQTSYTFIHWWRSFELVRPLHYIYPLQNAHSHCIILVDAQHNIHTTDDSTRIHNSK
jgi:hypothetical protein